MTEKVSNGSYVFNQDCDELIMVEYIEELLQNIRQKLTTRRGSFYPNKDFGSLIRCKNLKKPVEEYALAYARQALDSINGVYVKSACVSENSIEFNVCINDEERVVNIQLENDI